MNLPNKLTMGRIFAIPVFIIVFLMDYRIATLQETKIMDVFRYVARSREEAKPEYEAS